MKKSQLHDENGFEKPDPRPMELPVGLKRPPTLQELILQTVRSERFQAAARARGEETLSDSMDFDVEEDPDAVPMTVHEVRDMQEEVIAEGAAEYARLQEAAARKARKEASKPATKPAEAIKPADPAPPPPKPPEAA